jgi:hypothetical protein
VHPASHGVEELTMNKYGKTCCVAVVAAALAPVALHAGDKTDAIQRGPGQVRTAVIPGGHDEYVVRFKAGEMARVIASGNGYSDLDMFVYDQNNDLVCSDDDDTDEMVCTWVPERSGYYTIRIRNLGDQNRYVMQHN